MEVQDKVALITGGASGIGRAIAERLLQLEVKGIALIDLDNEKGKETTKQLTEKYGEGRTLFISCNVTSKDGLEAAFVKTKSTFGGLDLVFNNAGVMDEFNWELTVDVNLKAVVTGTYLALEHMGTKHGGNGGIVMNTASIIGFVPSPFVPMYGTTKAAVIEFTRSVAEELRFKENNIRVAAFCPSKTDTPMQTNVHCRYLEDFNEVNDPLPFTPISHLMDTIMKIITSDNMNGAIVIATNPSKMAEFPEVVLS
ncbi:15-hydroxyprostaglandin dehydrogenase [NAD(+)]-like isoform X1 [Glandiceps talaboti]